MVQLFHLLLELQAPRISATKLSFLPVSLGCSHAIYGQPYMSHPPGSSCHILQNSGLRSCSNSFPCMTLCKCIGLGGLKCLSLSCVVSFGVISYDLKHKGVRFVCPFLLLRASSILCDLYPEGNESPQEFAEQVVREGHLYNGFNLVVADICTSTMVYVCNRPDRDSPSYALVTPGIHVLANASLDAPWAKAERMRQSFEEFIGEYGESDFPIKEMVEKLMTSREKDEESVLPGVQPREREHPLSAIFVEVEFSSGYYGTRSSSALFVKSNKEVTFYEKYLDLNQDQKQWKDKMVTYKISEI